MGKVNHAEKPIMTFQVPDREAKAAIVAASTEAGTTVSEFIRQAIAEKLNEEQTPDRGGNRRPRKADHPPDGRDNH